LGAHQAREPSLNRKSGSIAQPLKGMPGRTKLRSDILLRQEREELSLIVILNVGTETGVRK
jgi:hypothetical protein